MNYAILLLSCHARALHRDIAVIFNPSKSPSRRTQILRSPPYFLYFIGLTDCGFIVFVTLAQQTDCRIDDIPFIIVHRANMYVRFTYEPSRDSQVFSPMVLLTFYSVGMNNS